MECEVFVKKREMRDVGIAREGGRIVKRCDSKFVQGTEGNPYN